MPITDNPKPPCTHAKIVTAMLLTLLLAACGGSGGGQPNSTTPSEPSPAPPPYTYSQPQQTQDGWQTADANTVGVDVDALTTLIDRINNNTFGYRRIDGLAIVQNGQLIFEENLRTTLDVGDSWANNRDINLHVINSVTKSVMSLAMGIAIEQGLIAGLDASIYDYLPSSNINNWSEQKASINVGDYLTMRHGYEWDEWNVNYLDPSNQNSQMNNSSNPIQFLLDLPMANDPGTTFTYSTGVSYALGVMIGNANGSTFFNFLDNQLLQPLGINNVRFWTLNGELHAGSALYLSLRDMAKIGQLVLDGGRWQGLQIVPEAWIAESTAAIIDLGWSNNTSYGYQWWSRPFERDGEQLRVVLASGFGGQIIYIVEQLDAVIIFTGHRYNDGDAAETDITAIMEQYILPALTVP